MPDAHTLTFLLIDLVIIIAAARSLGWVAKRMGQPAVIGEITAGIMLGPTLLGRIGSDLPGRLFPADVPLRSIADLGLVFFMFLVGLELDSRLIREQGKKAVVISLSGIIAPLAGGLVLGYALLDVNNAGIFMEGTQHPPGASVFALFLGAAMCITAFPVLARILVETGLYKTPVGSTILCAAAVDDVCAWILLAAVIGVANTGSPAEAGEAFVLTLIFVTFMFTVVRRALELLARRYDVNGRLSVDQVAVVLAGVLLSAYATELIGIHSIFGAFIFGAIMPKRSGMTHELTDKVEDFTVIVLLPVFFVVAGLRTNLFTLDSPALLGWLLLIVGVAIAGKFLGCGLAVRLTGGSRRDAVLVGALMNTRGLTELVILSIGISLGVLSDRTFAMMVIMALVTTAMAAPIINRIMPRESIAREIADAAGVSATVAAYRALVAIGNPRNAQALVGAGIHGAGRTRPGELLLVRLIPTSRAPEFRTGLLDEEREVSASLESMWSLVEQAAKADLLATPVTFLTDDVGRDLSRFAAEHQCELLLLGWHRPSLERRVIRALVHRTFALARNDIAVFVDREGSGIVSEARPYVLIILTGGLHDDAVSRHGARYAMSLQADIVLVEYGATPGSPEARDATDSLARHATALEHASGMSVVSHPTPADTRSIVELSSGAAVALIGLGDDWNDDQDFGQPATEVALESRCPLLVVCAAGRGRRRRDSSRLRFPRLKRESHVTGA
ncbi:MAG TPA: cation:proton antiporter [Thermomicrobiales bacterium]|nr:cation:proton antiporter [Thermomicrobiales bacterium]